MPDLCFAAQQTPLQSLRGVEGRSWGWSLVTYSIKCSTTGTAWTCVPSASARERTAGCCMWTFWWVNHISHQKIKVTQHPDIHFSGIELNICIKYHGTMFNVHINAWLSRQLLQCDGNLFDAISIAIKAALFNTRWVTVSFPIGTVSIRKCYNWQCYFSMICILL